MKNPTRRDIKTIRRRVAARKRNPDRSVTRTPEPICRSLASSGSVSRFHLPEKRMVRCVKRVGGRSVRQPEEIVACHPSTADSAFEIAAIKYVRWLRSGARKRRPHLFDWGPVPRAKPGPFPRGPSLPDRRPVTVDEFASGR